MEKPKYVIEIEKHTGLVCVADPEDERRWNVISPTGVSLFVVFSHSDGIVGGISSPDMFAIQGISREERSRRRRENY